jgi:hypothetical protein
MNGFDSRRFKTGVQVSNSKVEELTIVERMLALNEPRVISISKLKTQDFLGVESAQQSKR